MNDEKSKTAMASEIIAEHENIITELNKHIKELNMDIFKIRSIFRAVHYSIISGAISDTEIGPAMSSIQTMLDVLSDNAIETTKISTEYLKHLEH